MQKIRRYTAFKRDFKRILNSGRHTNLTQDLDKILRLLINNQPLDVCHNNYHLIGDWSGYTECHIRPNLLLIYQKPDEGTLRLIRLGSCSELFE